MYKILYVWNLYCINLCKDIKVFPFPSIPFSCFCNKAAPQSVTLVSHKKQEFEAHVILENFTALCATAQCHALILWFSSDFQISALCVALGIKATNLSPTEQKRREEKVFALLYVISLALCTVIYCVHCDKKWDFFSSMCCYASSASDDTRISLYNQLKQ